MATIISDPSSSEEASGTEHSDKFNKITKSMHIINRNIQKHLTSRKDHRTQLQSIAFHSCKKPEFNIKPKKYDRYFIEMITLSQTELIIQAVASTA